MIFLSRIILYTTAIFYYEYAFRECGSRFIGLIDIKYAQYMAHSCQTRWIYKNIHSTRGFGGGGEVDAHGSFFWSKKYLGLRAAIITGVMISKV